MTNLTEEEQHDFANYNAACQKGHENVTEDTNKKAAWAVWQNYVILAALIFLIFGGTENARLSAENDRLSRKNLEHAETKEAFLGFALNKKNKLERATKLNTYRENGFPLLQWHPHLAEKMILLAIELNHNNALEWVVMQPEWFTILSNATVNKVKSHLEGKNENKPIISQMTLKEKRIYFRDKNGDGRRFAGASKIRENSAGN